MTCSCSQAKKGAGAAEAGLDLIEDEQHAVTGAEFAYLTDIAARWHNHPGPALDWLQNDGGHCVFALAGIGFEQSLKPGITVGHGLAGQQRKEFAQPLAAGHRQRPQGLAVQSSWHR